ncbi:hypothetical protein ACPVPU_10690 [Sphingomonas sp. CJ99]
MMKGVKAMAVEPMDPTPGIGETAQKQRRRRIAWILAALIASGFAVGFLSARLEKPDGGFLEGIPAYWAIAASAIWLIAVCYGGWRLHKATDELERSTNRFASVIALNIYLVGYPVWFFLWKGALLPEPSHEAIFVVIYLTLILTYLWKKLRT